MEKQIEPRLKNIETYLKIEPKEYFIIPEYQRPYSWSKNQCDKLWQDILDYIDIKNKDNYFFGTVIISCENNKLSLIDGQQRTTTFMLLLKALLININDAIINCANDKDSKKLYIALKDKRSRIIRLLYSVSVGDFSEEPNDKLDKKVYNKTKKFINSSIREAYKNELNNILKSSSYDEAQISVEKIKYKQNDNKYTNYFRNFKFFYEKAKELSDSKLNTFANTLLESCEVIVIKSWNVDQAIKMFNSLNADGLPLCDADIISSLLYSAAQNKKCSKEYEKNWYEFQSTIDELEQEKLLSIDSILMQEMYYERALSGDNSTTTPGLRNYFKNINKTFINNPIESSKSLINITKIWKKIYQCPITQVLFKFNENFKLFLAIFLYRFDEKKITEEDVSVMLNSMLRLFTILELVDIGFSSKQFKGFLFNEQAKLVNKKISINEIKKDFDDHIKDTWSEKDIKNAIMNCENGSLIFLNEYLFAKEKKLEFNLNRTYDIEHIMPNSGKNLELIRADANISDRDEFNGYVDKIGNKILLEYNINRSIGNEWFRTKVSTTITDKTGYKDSKFPIASYLSKEYKDKKKIYWTKEDISSATEKAADRITKFIFDK